MKRNNVVTLLALIHFAGLAQAAPVVPTGTNPQTGQPWAAGDSYRLIFITSVYTQATSTDIDYYNTFAQTAADNSTVYDIGSADGYTWKVVGSTATVDAKTNTATDPMVDGVGEPILLLDGSTIVANDYADLWDHSVQNGIGLTETGTMTTLPWPWTGSYWDGTASTGGSRGNPLGVSEVAQGNSTNTANWVWRTWTMDPYTNAMPVMALSEVLTIGGPESRIQLTITRNDTNPNHYDFKWDSLDNYLYDLVSSTDLSADPATWPVWDGRADMVGSAPTDTLTDVPGGGDPTRFFAVLQKDPPPIYEEDFEADNGGFSATGTPNDWAWGTPNSNNDVGLVLTTGNGGSTNCWATNLGDGSGPPSGTIDTAADSILRSADIDLTGISGAQLHFAAAVDSQTGDTVEVLVREVGTDTLLDTIVPVTSPLSADWNDLGPFDLSAADNKNMYLEFRFKGTDAVYIGLYIDDVVVTAK